MRIPFRPEISLGRRFIEISRDECATVLRILMGGWENALAEIKICPDTGEVEITECLRDGMEKALRDGVVRQNRQISVLPGTQSRSSSEVLRPDGLTDISIHIQRIREEYDQHPPHVIIECKRVAGNRTDLCRLYVVDGVDDRFKNSKYAGNHAIAFMAGYVLVGAVEDAIRGINKYLTRKGRQSEHLELSNILDLPWAWSSSHIRSGAPAPIYLHHAFLSFQRTVP